MPIDQSPPAPVDPFGGGSSSTIVDALRQGVLDPELAALIWVLLEGRVGCVVAGEGDDPADRARRGDVLDAVVDLVPAGRIARSLDGEAEDFAWLEEAEALGWRRTTPADASPDDPGTTLILPGELGGSGPGDAPGDRARLVVRTVGRGYAIAATVRGARLEDVLDLLRARPIRLTDDELSRLGIVLVLAPGSTPRLAVAHYLRPLARDAHGHPQRLPPAVLAAWDESDRRFEHFAWGLTTELAARVGRRRGELELEVERRRLALAGLAGRSAASSSRATRAEVRSALEAIRLGAVGPSSDHRH